MNIAAARGAALTIDKLSSCQVGKLAGALDLRSVEALSGQAAADCWHLHHPDGQAFWIERSL